MTNPPEQQQVGQVWVRIEREPLRTLSNAEAGLLSKVSGINIGNAIRDLAEQAAGGVLITLENGQAKPVPAKDIKPGQMIEIRRIIEKISA